MCCKYAAYMLHLQPVWLFSILNSSEHHSKCHLKMEGKKNHQQKYKYKQRRRNDQYFCKMPYSLIILNKNNNKNKHKNRKQLETDFKKKIFFFFTIKTDLIKSSIYSYYFKPFTMKYTSYFSEVMRTEKDRLSKEWTDGIMATKTHSPFMHKDLCCIRLGCFVGTKLLLDISVTQCLHLRRHASVQLQNALIQSPYSSHMSKV